MSHAAKRFLLVCLLSLPTAAFAGPITVYPLTGQPDIYVDNLTYTINYTGATATSLNLTGSSVYLPLPSPNGTLLPGGAVEAMSDIPGTACSPNPGPCELGGLSIVFNANASGFTITGQTIADYKAGTNGITTYLAGTFVAGSYQNPGGLSEFGELFTITAENLSEMDLLEQTFKVVGGTTNGATNLIGAEVFFDFDSLTSDGDMEPHVQTPVPEPTTLTLLSTGLVAGLLRKRLARKRA